MMPKEKQYRGLYPTPAAVDHSSPTNLRKAASYNETGSHAMSLNHFMAEGLLPTPRVGGQEGYETRKARQGHEKAVSYLEAAVEWQMSMGMLPTPTCNDLKNVTLCPSQVDRNDSIVKRIVQQDPEAGKTSQLNPLFVEEMMGFPRYWTLMPFLRAKREEDAPPKRPTTTGATKRSRHTATQ